MEKPVLAAFLSCSGQTLTDEEKYLFEKTNPAGITLFGRNIKNKQQLKSLTNQIKEVVGRDNFLIAIDQEGGRVRRLKEPDFKFYASQSEIGSLPLPEALEETKRHAQLISSDLKEIGINVNFAPVLDIARPTTTEALRSRCFSSDIKTVSALGKTMVTTYLESGIIPCIKHMPGHGAAVSDPHLGLPVINSALSDILNELVPFKDCSFALCGMTAHILLTEIDADHPVTQSAVAIQTLIREAIGFKGLLLSDAIEMKALKGSVSEKAALSIAAGCDCVCYCLGDMTDMEELSLNCPHLSDIGQERLDKACAILHNHHKISDKETLHKQYASLFGQMHHYDETYDATEVLNILKKKEQTTC